MQVASQPVLSRPSEIVSAAVPSSVQTIVGVRSCDSGIQGPENLILALADMLREQGIRYIIVNLWDGTPPSVALHEEALRRGLESHVVATSSSLDPAILPRLAVTLRRLKPDVIHTHDFKSEMTVLAANQLLRLPVVGSFYGRLAIGSFYLKIEDWLRLFAFRFFDHVLANSQAQYAELVRWRVPVRRLGMLYSFVDARRIRPASAEAKHAARQKLGIGLEQPVLATIARLSPNKGHRYMLEALVAVRGRFPDLLYLVPGEGDMAWHGDGAARGDLADMAAKLGVAEHVRFLGYYPDLQTILDAADILVSPSLREGMQVSLLEAMAAGLPVVATNIGGTPDAVVDGVTGLLVPPADATALGQAVNALLATPERMRQMGEHARQRAETVFDVQVQAARLVAVCEGVARRG